MNKFYFILILLLSGKVYGQEVLKERLVGYSYVIPGHSYDSAALHYPNRNLGYSGEYSDMYNQNNYWSAPFDSISRYYSPSEPHSTRIFNRNKSKNEMTVDLELRNDTIPKNHYATKEYIKVDSKTKNILQTLLFGYSQSLKEVVLNAQYFLYDKQNRKIKDSLINYDYLREAITLVQTKTIMYGESAMRKSTMFTADTIGTNVGKYKIEFWNPRGLLTQTDTYEITDSQSIENYNIEYRFYDQKDRQTQLLKTELTNGFLDTISNTRTLYTDSTSVNKEIRYEISENININYDTLTQHGKTLKAYRNDNLILQEWYSKDGSNWKKNRIFTYKYNERNQLTEMVYTDVKQRTTFFHNGGRRILEYTAQGNLSKYSVFYTGDYGATYNKTTEYNYYYEPYLEKETNLNYTRLNPIAYPNSFADNVNILFSCVPNKAGTITFSNLQGEIIERHNFSSPSEIYQYTWSRSDLPRGVYLAKIVMGKEVATVRLVKL